MTLEKLSIALAQINPVVGDLAGNRDKVIGAVKAAPPDTGLVVFPELVLCGYPPEDLVLKPSFLDAVDQEIKHLANYSRAHNAALLVGAPVRENGKLYNAAHLIGAGKILATIRKHHLPNYGVFDEKRVFSSASLADPVDYKGHRLGIMICEDMWYPDSARHLKDRGAGILIVPNASPFDLRNRQARHDQARARAVETGLPLIYVNQWGGQDDLVFDGGSFVLDAKGQYVLRGQDFCDDLISTSAPGMIAAPMDDKEALYHALMTGLHDYVDKNGFPGVILGLSGGIDSALSAAIAVDALGPDRVRGVMMPSQYTSRDSLEDAAILARNLGIRLDTIGIENAVNSFEQHLAPFLTPATPGVVYENIQPRCRGVILMALSNAEGFMVLSTGNKSEMAVGYATLYGDMCGGFNILKDVYKTKVYELARWRNDDVAGGAVIPERSLTKAPTAELKPGQTDQDTLPPYSVLDKILEGFIEYDQGPADLIAAGFDTETVHRVWRMVDRAEHKRRQSPPGPRVTFRAFGRDRRHPITNGFNPLKSQ